ncbi:hypothetical protein B296_00020626 [Ensete ventricosum]|uniref:Uncharacterized protein n=1 Tax=Ensete ventricosum TaxID=4639 RepID=A0A426ZI09_ENSVE|nr:hypothetical protein B296_00020626 [Ensete ventricosum]
MKLSMLSFSSCMQVKDIAAIKVCMSALVSEEGKQRCLRRRRRRWQRQGKGMLTVDEGIKCRSDGLQLWQRLEMVALGRVRRGVEGAVANVEGSPMVGEATEVVIALKEGMTAWVVSRRWGLKGR